MEGLLNGFLYDKIDLDLAKNQKTQRVTMLYLVYTFIQMMLLKLLKLKNHQLEENWKLQM